MANLSMEIFTTRPLNTFTQTCPYFSLIQGICTLGFNYLPAPASYAINSVECLDRNKAEELIACYRSADVAAAAQANAAS